MTIKESRASEQYHADCEDLVGILIANPTGEPSLHFARLMKLGGEYDHRAFLAALGELADAGVTSGGLRGDDTGTAGPYIAQLMDILVELESRAGFTVVS